MQKNHGLGQRGAPDLSLKGFAFKNLFTHAGLKELDESFLEFFKALNAESFASFLAYRHAPSPVPMTPELSDQIIAWAKILETFLAERFDIEEAVAISQALTVANNPISAFKKYYVLRRARKELQKKNHDSFEAINDWLHQQLATTSLTSDDEELAVCLLGLNYLQHPDDHQENIEQLVKWCVSALTTELGRSVIKRWKSFQIPERIDYQNLVPTQKVAQTKLERLEVHPAELRLRDGFDLTDPRMTARDVQDEVNYCIYCHDHEGDFCSRGFPEKKSDPQKGFKRNPLDVILTGCPLEEKISEMNVLKRDGHTLGALAVVMIDNPLCPATGHRICNDCMKSCIYQKQDPVNIPQIETRVLTDVLALPWGVEIYDLLTRWNPLRQYQWIMKPYNGLKVMVAGMGPAGFTLAHHLLMEGFAVVGLDGLKIEPLAKNIYENPIRDYQTLTENLSERLMSGFGGVAEYGITVRWDKNFLKLIYLSLMRRPYFQVFGSVRFGGTIQIEDAWEMGFDHFAVAVGAGLPKALNIPKSLAPGMRQANDFLMALQLGSAAKLESITNLQIRLPAVVIGGGLTGVDTATELQAYYISQVEKILYRFEILQMQHGLDKLREQFDVSGWEILQEYIRHATEVRKERLRATNAGETPNFIKLIHAWGGVTIVYRRTMQESPAYINNHEELKKALEEGVYYAENLEPIAIEVDENNYSRALICQRRVKTDDGYQIAKEDIHLNARSILVATGTQPNIAYEFEHRGTFTRLNFQYQHYEDNEGQLTVAPGALHCKEEAFGPFTSYQKSDYRVSLIGDTHPAFHGSVVKAIASGMRTYPKILQSLAPKLGNLGNDNEYDAFATRMREEFNTTIESIVDKTDTLLELTVKAPLAAKHFRAGQFFRLQNYESRAKFINKTRLVAEPKAVVIAKCDKHTGSLTFYLDKRTPAAKIFSQLSPGETIALMGPTGVRAKIPSEGETVLIIGDLNSFSFILSYGTELQLAGNKIIYLLHYNQIDEVFCKNELEALSDCLIWNSSSPLEHDIRQQDYFFQTPSNTEALLAYDALNPAIPLRDVDRVFIFGNTTLLRQFQRERNNELKQHLLKDPKVIASVYGNMQCMLKGVCAQCLQWQIDPETGQRTKAVFACSWQDQPLEIIDIDHIDSRAQQNHVHEKLTNLWLDYILK